MNLKVADFGFATFRKVHALKSYKGTKTYMAPEIKEQKTYDGMQIDIFSTGVILFIIVQGIFPFQEAKKDEYYYNLLLKGDHETYWKKTGGQKLSEEFKDLVLKMFAYDGSQRPTLKEIADHPWMQASCNVKKIQNALLSELTEKRSSATSATSGNKGDARGEELTDLVLEERKGQVCAFHDQSDFIYEGVPGNLFDAMQQFNEEEFESKMQLEHVAGKHIKLTIPAADAEEPDTVVKVKFYKHGDNQLLAHFSRKSGDIMNWYRHIDTMKATALDFLGSPNVPVTIVPEVEAA